MRKILMIIMLVSLTGCTTVHSQLNYKPNERRISFAKNEQVKIWPVKDDRVEGTTVIGKFVFSGSQGNVIHQPEGFLAKLSDAYRAELLLAGFKPSTEFTQMEIKPSLIDMDCTTDMNTYGSCNMSMRVVVVDHGETAIDEIYEVTGSNKKGVIGWGVVDLCSSAMEESTKLIISQVVDDLKLYMQS